MCADKWEQDRDERQKRCEQVCEWSRKLAAALGPEWSSTEWRDTDTGRLIEHAPCKIVHVDGPTLSVFYEDRNQTVRVGVTWPRGDTGPIAIGTDEWQAGCKVSTPPNTFARRILKWMPLYIHEWHQRVGWIRNAEQGYRECVEQAHALAALLPPAEVREHGGPERNTVSVHFRAKEITRFVMYAGYPPEEARITRMDLYGLSLDQTRAVLTALAQHAPECGSFAIGEECECTYCMNETIKGAPWDWRVTLMQGAAEATVAVRADTAGQARDLAIGWHNGAGTRSEVRVLKPWDDTLLDGERVHVLAIKREQVT